MNEPVLKFGIVYMPITFSNFTDEEGKQLLDEAICNMANEALIETVNKIIKAAHYVCAKNGVKLQMMDPDMMTSAAMQALQQAPGAEKLKGVITDDGKPIIDTDYAEFKTSGGKEN